MKLYRYPDHYEAVDGADLFTIPRTLDTIRHLGRINPLRYTPTGRLIRNPLGKLLFPIINLIARYRKDEFARTPSSTLPIRISSALVKSSSKQ